MHGNGLCLDWSEHSVWFLDAKATVVEWMIIGYQLNSEGAIAIEEQYN